MDSAEKTQLQTLNSTDAEGRDEEDYDPHKHRQVKNATSNFDTLVHLVKSSIGTGILAMPQAFSNAGIVLGTVMTLIIGFVLTHCLHMLIRSQYVLCKRKQIAFLNYPDSMQAALDATESNKMKKLKKTSVVVVDFFMVLYQLGVCCVYIVFTATNDKKLIDPYYEMSTTTHMFIVLLPLLLLNCIPNLKKLAPFSTLANILAIIGIGFIFSHITVHKISDKPLDAVGTMTGFSLFFGTTLFALTAVGVVVSLEANMKDPKAFTKPTGVLNIGMGFVTVLYAALGAVGYNFCSDKCSDSVTLDIPPGWLSTTILILYIVSILISYALQCYPPVEILWGNYLRPYLTKKETGGRAMIVYEYTLRIALCLLTFVLAVSVPRLGDFISLFGAFCLSALGIIFPVFMDVCVSLPDKFGPMHIKLIKNVLIIIMGLIGMCAGTYAALKSIITSFF